MSEIVVGHLHSYPTIYGYGHKGAEELFDGPVVIQEKVDGSQFSFGIFGTQLCFRSKRADIVPGAAGMFEAGVNAILERAELLHPGWQYRGEYLQKPKHNALAYDRVPVGHVILFDIDTGDQCYLSPAEVRAEAERIGLEAVPTFYEGDVARPALDYLKGLLETISVLGGQKIEGVVIKNYARFGGDKKVLMGKLVSEAFKEVHQGAWRENNPKSGDVIEQLIDMLATPARREKAVLHLRERGELTGTPKDIGPLIVEIQQDTAKEEGDTIRDLLYRWAWKHISRGITRGVPEWYKAKLAEAQFGSDCSEEE